MLTNLPNLLTLSRIGVIPLLIATFYIESDLGNWLGLGVLVYAGITDFIDGLVARLMSQQSSRRPTRDTQKSKKSFGKKLSRT